MKKILTFAAAAMLAATAFAIRPLHIPYAIPDGSGSTVMLYKHGDMGLAFYTTLDDRIVIRNAAGHLVYALEQDGGLVPSEVRVHDIARRSASELKFALEGALSPAAYGEARRQASGSGVLRSASPIQRSHYASTTDGLGKYGTSALGSQPSIGKFNIPVIMVEFADTKFKESTTAEYMTRFYNEEGFNDVPGVRYQLYGSVRDYFLDQSRGLFDPTFDVVAKVTLSNGYAYYGANNSYGADRNAYAMVREAVTLAQAQGVDFTQYVDATKGNVPLVSILYAGQGEATGGDENTIWPHQYDFPTVQSNIGGTRFGSYFVGNELYGNYPMGMGVFVHEFCHALGLPDFYDPTYSYEGNQPFGLWSVMDGGPYNEGSYSPVRMTAYERSYLGWLSIPEMKETQAVTLSDPDADYGSSMFLMRQKGSQKDYFIFENVNEGKWAPSGSGAGLLVTRYHYDINRWEYNSVNSMENKKMAMVVTANGDEINAMPRPGHLYGTSVFDIPDLPRWDGKREDSHPIYQIARHEDGTLTLNFGERNLYSTTVSDGRLYHRVDDVADLAAGDSIILVSNSEAQALSIYQAGNSRAVTPIMKRADGDVEGNPEVLVLRAVQTKDGSKWGLNFRVNNTNYYLAANSSGALTTVTKTSDNCLGTIGIVDGNAVIKLGSGSVGTLTYYTDNTRVACSDGSEPTGLSIYRLSGRSASGIDHVAADAPSAAPTAVFTLSGRYVGNSLDGLPGGIYVVNGKKVKH